MIPAIIIDNTPHVRCYRCRSYFIRHNASTDACDMLEGACACGAWHNINEVIRCRPCKTLSTMNIDQPLLGRPPLPPPPTRPLAPESDGLSIPPPGPDHDVHKGGFPT